MPMMFKKDPKAARDYIEKILVFDPADPNALNIKAILDKAINKPAKPATQIRLRSPLPNLEVGPLHQRKSHK